MVLLPRASPIMAGLLKKTTGLTGLVVAKDAHKTLSVLYNKILKTLQKMPNDAAYRKNTEVIINERLAIIQSDSSVAGVEKKINCGQIEELVLQAERELNLTRQMLQWKPWEPMLQEAPQNQWKWPI